MRFCVSRLSQGLKKGKTLLCRLCQLWEKSRFVLWRTLAPKIRTLDLWMNFHLCRKSYCWNSWTRTLNLWYSRHFDAHYTFSMLCYYFFTLGILKFYDLGVFYFGSVFWKVSLWITLVIFVLFSYPEITLIHNIRVECEAVIVLLKLFLRCFKDTFFSSTLEENKQKKEKRERG